MSTIQEIEQAIEQLPRDQVLQLGDWFSRQYSTAWDSQIEEDIHAGHLDKLAEEALAEYRAGRTLPFPVHE